MIVIKKSVEKNKFLGAPGGKSGATSYFFVQHVILTY